MADRRGGVPTDYVHAGEGDILNLLYEKVITGNGDDSLLISRTKLEGRAENAEGRLDKVEKNQGIILKLAWAILLVLIGNLVETIRVDAARPEPQIQQHTSMF